MVVFTSYPCCGLRYAENTLLALNITIAGGTTGTGFGINFFQIIIFCCVVAICDLVHDEEAINGIC